MVKGLARSLSRGSILQAPIVRQDIPISGLAVSNIDGATGVGWGTSVIAGLPEGSILLLGAVLSATITEASANITDTFDGDFSVGSAPTADATLSGGEVDIIPSTAMGAAVASVNDIYGVSTSTESGKILDNRGATLELNLNVLIDDAAIDADNQTVTVNGVLSIAYIVLGD